MWINRPKVGRFRLFTTPPPAKNLSNQPKTPAKTAHFDHQHSPDQHKRHPNRLKRPRKTKVPGGTDKTGR
jgi:hypothetical protein